MFTSSLNKNFEKFINNNNINAMTKLKLVDPEAFNLLKTSYSLGFGDAMRHVLTVLIDNEFI